MNPENRDQTLTCQDCGRSFTWTVRDQQVYETQRHLPPERCSTCRQAQKAEQARASRHYRT